jgi:hypothetical protein
VRATIGRAGGEAPDAVQGVQEAQRREDKKWQSLHLEEKCVHCGKKIADATPFTLVPKCETCSMVEEAGKTGKLHEYF